MLKITIRILMVVLFFTAVVFTGHHHAMSQTKPQQISLDIKVEKEVKLREAGKMVVERQPAEKTNKGDILVYKITYKNITSDPVKSVSVVDPVPKGTIYISGSAAGRSTEIRFSIDGGNTFKKEPVKYISMNKDKSKSERIASPDMYTHVSWVVKKTIAPGESGQVSFKVVVK